jgi:hypothetical protein
MISSVSGADQSRFLSNIFPEEEVVIEQQEVFVDKCEDLTKSPAYLVEKYNITCA